jgi:hypothetical protein
MIKENIEKLSEKINPANKGHSSLRDKGKCGPFKPKF